MKTEPTTLSSLFSFKNKETEDEINRVVSSYEGVEIQNVSIYLRHKLFLQKSKLYLEVKQSIKVFWQQNPTLTLTDVVGLFEVVLNDVQQEMIKKGDDYVKEVFPKQNGIN